MMREDRTKNKKTVPSEDGESARREKSIQEGK